MTKEKTKRLDKKHERENNTNSCSRLRIQPPHEVGIHHIIKARNKHRHNSRNGHFKNYAIYWSLSQKFIFISFLQHYLKLIRNIYRFQIHVLSNVIQRASNLLRCSYASSKICKIRSAVRPSQRSGISAFFQRSAKISFKEEASRFASSPTRTLVPTLTVSMCSV